MLSPFKCLIGASWKWTYWTWLNKCHHATIFILHRLELQANITLRLMCSTNPTWSWHICQNLTSAVMPPFLTYWALFLICLTVESYFGEHLCKEQHCICVLVFSSQYFYNYIFKVAPILVWLRSLFKNTWLRNPY